MSEIIQQRLDQAGAATANEEEQALKEIFQEIGLYALWRAGFFAVAAFQGGTSLRILHGLPRFSEDLDFLLLEPAPEFDWLPYLEKLLGVFEEYGVKCEALPRGSVEKAVRAAEIKDNSVLNQLNLSLLDRSERELQDVQRQLRALAERRIYLASEVARLSGNSELFTEDGERVYSPQDRLKYLEAQLATLEALYSERHPDVVRTRREIEGLSSSLQEMADETAGRSRELLALRAKRESLAGRLAESHPDIRDLDREIAATEMRLAEGVAQDSTDPTYLQLKAQLVAVQAEEQSLEQLRDELKARIIGYERKLAETPLIEKDYMALQLDLEGARLKYREVKAREMEAVLAENMETDRKGERLTMIEPPLPPEQPASPDRPLLMVAGLLLAIASGIGTVVVAEATDTTVRGREVLEELVAMPALGLIPRIQTRADVRRQRVGIAAGGATAVVAVIVVALLVHLLVMPLDVLWYAAVRRLTLQAI